MEVANGYSCRSISDVNLLLLLLLTSEDHKLKDTQPLHMMPLFSRYSIIFTVVLSRQKSENSCVCVNINSNIYTIYFLFFYSYYGKRKKC